MIRASGLGSPEQKLESEQGERLKKYAHEAPGAPCGGGIVPFRVKALMSLVGQESRPSNVY